MKGKRLFAVMLLAVLLTAMVPTVSLADAKWKDPPYDQAWVLHFANATYFTKPRSAVVDPAKVFTRLRVRWEPRAYTTSDGSKQDVYNFDTTNRVRKNTTLRYFYPNQSLSIVGYTKVNGTWYLVDLGTTYKEGRYGWVYGGYIKFTK